MGKRLPLLVVVHIVFVMSSWSYGASDKCTVMEAENNILVLKCNKKTELFQVNDTIKIKSMKKKSIEGR